MRRSSKVAWLALVAGFVSVTAAAAAPATNFYKGKTVTIIVPASPGGGYDLWARLAAPFMQKYLGAAQVKVENMPGGGTLIGTNQVYNSAPDGLTFGEANAAGDVFAEMAKAAGVQFKIAKFNWLGRADDDPHIIAVHPNSPYKTFDDLVALKGGKTILHCLASGKGSSDYNAVVITMNAFHVPFQMVAAFKGSHEEKATFLAGDGDTIAVSASTIAQLGSSQARVILLSAAKPFAKLPGVPTVVQEAEKHHLPTKTVGALRSMAHVMAMGHAFFAPPGVPAERLQALRAAFRKTFQNKDFRAKAKKGGLYIGYEPPAFLKNAAEKAFEEKSEFVPLLKTS